MEDEIDLRAYIQIVLRGWRLIIGLTVLGALVAGGVSFILPEIYEATALVSVSQARYSLRLEGASQNVALPLKAYPDLAFSDEVLTRVFDQVRVDAPASVQTLAEFRRQLTVAAAADPTLLRLTVRDQHPEHAARVANTWAQTLAQQAGQLYGQDLANLATYEAQLATMKSDLDLAEQALAAFQASNQAAILTAQLDSQQAILTDYLNRAHTLSLLALDAQNLRGRLAKLDPAAPAGSNEDVLALMLSARSLGGQISSPETPLQLQVSPGQAASDKTVAQQLALVDDLIQTLQVGAQGAQTQVGTLQPQLLATQGQLAEAQRQESELTRARDLVQEQYLALAGKLEEAKIVAQETANIMQVASQASEPTERTSPKRLTIMAAGGAVGALLSILGVLVWEWWRGVARVTSVNR